MENIPAENAEVEEHVRNMSQYCLGLPTVLRRVLEQFPDHNELMRLSFVNKLWNFEARSLMKERGNLIAKPVTFRNHQEDPCQQLGTFASALENMRVVPFVGIHFPIYHTCFCKSLSNGSFDPIYKVILDRLPWKHFAVRFLEDRPYGTGCPALFLVEKILEDHCEVVEELCLGLGNEEFILTLLQDRSLPRLKILKVEQSSSPAARDYLTNAFIKTMVSCAPNLQELHVGGYFNFTENFLEGSSAVLIPQHALRPLYHQICESLVGSLTAKSMEILIQDKLDIDPELLNSFIPKLLKASLASLKTLRMDILFAVPLMCYGICLENTTTLELHMNSYSLEYLEPSVRRLVTGLDFTRIFPNLTQVKILNNENFDLFSPDVITAFVQEGNEVLGRTLPDRAIKIKRLDLEGCGAIVPVTLALLAQMFPAVRTVHTRREHTGALFEDLRAHFPYLEELTESENGMGFHFMDV